jgi:hypothetical protein
MCDLSSLLGGGNAHTQRLIAIQQAQQQKDEAAALQAQQDRLYQQQAAAQQAQNDAQQRQFDQSLAVANKAQTAADTTAAKRTADVTANNAAIDQQFGQFDDNYYTNLVKSYQDANDPAVKTAAANARDQLIASLAGRGLAGSSVSAQKLSDVDQTTNKALGDISSQGADLANTLRGRVATTRGNLSQAALTAEDPAALGATAEANATALARSGVSQAGIPSPSITPIAGSTQTPVSSLFASLVQPFQTAALANMNSGVGLSAPTGVKAPVPSATGSSYVTS